MLKVFHHSDFLPIETLVKKKNATNTKISLVIPAFNEAATIGEIIRSASNELIKKHILLDEIIVMNSDSTDNTSKIATAEGAKVYSVSSIIPEYTTPFGKGCALWKSQFVAQGDILVCIDADICNFEPHFISGLVGPLLFDNDIVLAKAFYNRPLILDDHIYDNYGGRVTEILVRPLLWALMPELAIIKQPLSGEYAFRKKPLESIPFSSGYGVEIGLIFDIYKMYGLPRIAQVDMGTRCHRNRPINELSIMSLGIIQTMFRKLSQTNTLSLKNPCHNLMSIQTMHGLKQIETKDIELPAAIDMIKAG